MIIIHAEMKVNSAVESEFLESVKELIEASRSEEGNVSYKLFKDTEQENTYLMIEEWKDQEAVASHNTSAHFQAFVAKASKYLTAPLNVQAYAGQLINR